MNRRQDVKDQYLEGCITLDEAIMWLVGREGMSLQEAQAFMKEEVINS
jgi:hypothetical protein